MDSPTLRAALRGAGDDPRAACWLSFADPALAELVAGGDVDAVVLDMEHAPLSLADVGDLTRAVDAGSDGTTATLVRLPSSAPTAARRVVDLGVHGVVLPMVDGPAEVEAVVEATRYPPAGSRGVGAGRATDYGRDLDPDAVASTADPLVVPQVETAAALDSVEEIAAVDGVDALFLGPADLSAALGAFGAWEDDPFQSAVDRVVAAAREADVATATIALGEEQVERWVARGFDLVAVGFDAQLVTSGLNAATARFAAAVNEREE